MIALTPEQVYHECPLGGRDFIISYDAPGSEKSRTYAWIAMEKHYQDHAARIREWLEAEKEAQVEAAQGSATAEGVRVRNHPRSLDRVRGAEGARND